MTSSTEEETSSSSRSKFLCRSATVLLALQREINDRAAEIENVRNHLEEDPRVIWAELEEDQNSDFITVSNFFPDADRTRPSHIIKGSDGFPVMRFDQPIVFKAAVPIKNQPQHHNADDIPTDTYWVAWNGVVALVMWRHESGRSPLSGGHIAFDILEKAVNGCGHTLYNQACSPECENIFMHTNLLLTPSEECNRTHFVKRNESDIHLLFAEWEDEKDSLIDLFLDLGSSYENFARQKNTGRRIIDLESEAYTQLLHLLSHYAEHAQISTKPLLRRLIARWHGRGWRSEVRLLSSHIWLCISGIEILKRNWIDEKKAFYDDVEESGLEEIFAIDYGDDVERIETLDLTRLDSICSQMESRIDNTALSWTTVGGAMAGAITGSLASLLF
ncbi:hypothetical protein [Streptomyces sp. NPDC093591]|uniref:hypothetical protein n=1 Tax=Streptomyces sp. NPDC093591 TaxID=3366044 RepID=UPI003817D82D